MSDADNEDYKSDGRDSISSMSDTFTNIEDDDSSLYFSLFNKNKPTMKEIIEKCVSRKEMSVTIEGDHIKEIPPEFAEFDWIEDLTLDSTEITAFSVYPKKLKSLTIKHNKIELFDASMVPETVVVFRYNYNETKEIIGLREGITILDMSNNNFILIKCKIPSTVMQCDLSGNKLLRKIPELHNGENLKTLILNDTMVNCIDDIPDSVEVLDTCRCNINTVKKLPKYLNAWKSYNASIETIECEFPSGLEMLDLYGNSLVSCPDLPESIKDVDLNNNDLLSIPKFPQSILKIDLKSNCNLEIGELIKLDASYPNSKILYSGASLSRGSTYMSHMWSTPHDFLFQPTELPSISDSDYSNMNPHYIPLNKTYSV